MKKTNQILSRNTRALLELRGIKNKTKLAQNAGVHHKTVYDIHDGRGNPTLAILDTVAEKLKVPTWFLLQDQFNPKTTDIKQLLKLLEVISVLNQDEISELIETAQKIQQLKQVKETLATYELNHPLLKNT